ncbi:adult cuticle protein 1-like [Eupeodes corollae]|uniref:adult cuticle protein 1-like n=1 Tax=Eupeodes corollae TaxID=290404 RepID=UPI00249154AE|nr:adult cuticle protein 1-like [Eupeodes corollae]
MKFFICILALFALSLSRTQANIVPLALNPVLYSAAFGSSPVVVSAQSPVHLYNAPLIVPSVGLTPQASYVAKTPGSEHIASLPGHFISSSSINLEQAQGISTNENKIIKYSSSSLAPSVAVHGSVIPLTYSSFIVQPPASIVLPTQATYLAKNLGVEHIAPLPGHSISATSLNLEPAPGSQYKN